MQRETLNTFCSHCGKQFAEQKAYPRRCFYCGNDTYRNPIPVVVAIIPVDKNHFERGILILRRGNEPSKGEWALPGGFLEFGETWQQGLVREVKEEIGLTLQRESFTFQGIENSSTGNLIIFAKYPTLSSLPSFTPNDEATAIGLYTDSLVDLAFPTHTLHAKNTLFQLLNPQVNLSI